MNWGDESLRGEPKPPKSLTIFYIVLWGIIIIAAFKGV